MCLTAFTTGFVGVVLALSTGILLASNLGWMHQAGRIGCLQGWRMELVKEGSGSQESIFNGVKRDASGVLWVDPREESIWIQVRIKELALRFPSLYLR